MPAAAPLSEVEMFALKVVDGLSTGIEIPLRQNGSVSIGRAADADGQIEDGLCSGKHFEVEWSETAGILVRDLGSLNGVFVNGERVKEPRRIKRGDFVQAGTTLMEVAVASQQAGTEVRASDRAPALKGSATMMMSAADMQDAIARTRAEARVKQKDMGRTVVKTQMLDRSDIAKLMAEAPTGAAKTMILQALPQDLIATANQSGLTMLSQLLQATPAESPAVLLVKKGSSITPHAKSTVTIGRDARNDIPLVTDDVSGSHTRIVREPSGRFEVIDEGSTNGTYVNGKRVVRQYLNNGDALQIGQWVATIALHGTRLAMELSREGIKVQDKGGAIKVIKADAVGAKEWDPLYRERQKNVKVDYKRDREAMLAKKKKGKSADDIAFTATSDTQRKVLKGRLAWAGVVISPIVVLVVLAATRLDALAPGAVGAHHASPEFTTKAKAANEGHGGGLGALGDKVSCLACHKGGPVADATCSACHEQAPTERHTTAGLTCFDCHGEHNGRDFSPTAAAKFGCVGCHAGDPHETLAAQGGDKSSKHRAPLISQEKLAIDAFDVHKTHMSIEGHCLGCHAEGLKPVAADARKTCGTCHAQAKPEPDSCVTCHNQHPKGDELLAYLSTPVTPEDRLKAARIDPGNLSIFLALALGMFLPITVIGLIKPRERSDDDEVVEEIGGAKAAGPAAGPSPAAAAPAAPPAGAAPPASPHSAAPAAPPRPPAPPLASPPPAPMPAPPQMQAPMPPPPPPYAQAPMPPPPPPYTQAPMPPPPPPYTQAPMPPPPPYTQAPMPPRPHAQPPPPAGGGRTLLGTGAISLEQAKQVGTQQPPPSGTNAFVPGQRGPTGVEIPPPPPLPRR